jgi:hypothetical protein
MLNDIKRNIASLEKLYDKLEDSDYTHLAEHVAVAVEALEILLIEYEEILEEENE